jgi:5-(carboxyamino)imidazole ribonucleotide synthase
LERLKIGILGAGQLGRMTMMEALKWDIDLYFLDEEPDMPAGRISNNFEKGSFKNYEDVLRFGTQLDVIGIEIEHVNTDALRTLKSMGKRIIPDPDLLDIIKDKGLQKQFYLQHDLPTLPALFYNEKAELLQSFKSGDLSLPFVQKSRTAGYDGKGVVILRHEKDFEMLLDGPCIIEPLVDLDKELAITVARNEKGEVKTYPVVEMLFNPAANLVENLRCPANVDESVLVKMEILALKTIETFNITGLLAIECFLDKNGDIYINEVAPRTHNSGHHTIEACYTSQFEQHLRILMDVALGDTSLRQPAMMINLLGAPGHEGIPFYQGLDKVLELDNTYVHIYGKKKTKPFRKMGHVTLLGEDMYALDKKSGFVQSTLKVISNG